MEINFCQHGNFAFNCSICMPREKKIVNEGLACPVYKKILRGEIPPEICDNPGTIVIKFDRRGDIHTSQCTGCGWEFGWDDGNPHWVNCSCGRSELRKGFPEKVKCLQCSSKRFTCNTCGEVGARCTCQGGKFKRN